MRRRRKERRQRSVRAPYPVDAPIHPLLDNDRLWKTKATISTKKINSGKGTSNRDSPHIESENINTTNTPTPPTPTLYLHPCATHEHDGQTSELPHTDDSKKKKNMTVGVVFLCLELIEHEVITENVIVSHNVVIDLPLDVTQRGGVSLGGVGLTQQPMGLEL